MTKDEREALMRANAESRERLLDDMARRRRQRLEEPFDDDDDPLPQRTSPVVLNRGEHQVREHHERGRPVLDDATMQLWNAWLDQRCAAMIDARLEMLADVLGQESGDIEYRLRRDIKGFRASVTRKITEELVRKFGDDYFNVMRSDVLATLRRELGIASGDNIVDLPNPLRKV